MSDAESSVHSGPARKRRCTGVYRRRRPERTIFYQVVQCHLESWLAQHRDGVFSERDGALCFHPASALEESDVAALERMVATRVLRLFERRGV